MEDFMVSTRTFWTTSLGIGVGLMYFLRERRARRRAGVRGKIAYAANRSWRVMRSVGRDLAHRAHRTSGIVTRLRPAS
jgi:hypothetical protein